MNWSKTALFNFSHLRYNIIQHEFETIVDNFVVSA